MTLKILKYPNNSLLRKTKDVESVDDIREDIEKVREALNESKTGFALAANQVGVPWNFFVTKRDYFESNPEGVFINPSWKPNGNLEKMEEGCLSFSITLVIPRYENILVSWTDTSGKILTDVPFSFLGAQVVQHECEHLIGKTFLEHLPRIERFQIMSEIKKGRYA